MDRHQVRRLVRVALVVGLLPFAMSVTVHQRVEHGSNLHKLTSVRKSETPIPFRQPLENAGDTVYTAAVDTNEKQFKVVVDTGSFDVFMFSRDCEKCGSKSRLFNIRWDQKTWRKGIARFGSGTLWSAEVIDTISIGPVVSRNLSFWAVTSAEMSLLQSDTFQGILGLGPPRTALKYYQDAAASMRKQLRLFNDSGLTIDPEMQELAFQIQGSLSHSANEIPFVKKIGMTSVSVCFGKESTSGGFLVWHDSAVHDQPSKFVSIPVSGDSFWSARMGSVRLGSATRQISRGNNPFASPTELGCVEQACSAVLDTGCTLIAAPSTVADHLESVVSEWVREGGNCDDLSNLPDLEFTLGGVELSLPAESYMGTAYGELTEDAKDFLPNYTQSLQATQLCQPLIMRLDVDTENGPQWILGMPFFRQYYTNFVFSEELAAMNISFSEADDACEPGLSPADTNLRIASLPQRTRPSQLRIDASRIRVPRKRAPLNALASFSIEATDA